MVDFGFVIFAYEAVLCVFPLIISEHDGFVKSSRKD